MATAAEHPALRDLTRRICGVVGSTVRGSYAVRSISDAREIVAQAWYGGRAELRAALDAGCCWYVLHVDEHGSPSCDGASGPYTREQAEAATVHPGIVLVRREESRA